MKHMKKFLLPLLSVLILGLASSCTEEGDTFIYDGAYVYVEYPNVAGSGWQAEIELLPGGVYTTHSLYYDYFNEHIDQNMIENSFVMAYYYENGYDIALPANFVYTDVNNGEHTATIRYVVAEGVVRIIIESNDNTYDALQMYLRSIDPMYFKICMMVNI